MSNKNFIMKQKTDSGYDIYYPKTTIEQVDNLQISLDSKADTSLVTSKATIVYGSDKPSIKSTGDFWFKPKPTETLLPVGGRIFYIHNDNGATYKFWDASFDELTTQTVAGLYDAKYYAIVSGNPTADKFYVYDNTDHTYSGVVITGGLSAESLYWGYYETTTGVTANTIGSGKTNTNTVLGMGVPPDYSPNIWGYIKSCRDNKLNGCNDWFIASMAEQYQLIASNLVNWYRYNEIWSSVEDTDMDAYYYYYDGDEVMWETEDKGSRNCAFAVRAF